ncbi:MAG: tRNA (guanosine(37)-N1)-methyltransferase TrmD [Patescibacteria group bacterium]
MRFDVLTIFPEIINDYCGKSILWRAQRAGHIKVESHDFRKFTKDKHGHVDDSPYGGGPGMVLQVQPIFGCLKELKALSLRGVKRRSNLAVSEGLLRGVYAPRGTRNDKTRVIIMDPAGKKFDQKMAEKYSKLDRLVLIAGRYEGFDARIYKFVDERVSVGDYVLAGGELPALTIIEAVSRQIPGVLGNVESLKEETFEEGKKEYPHYTRPEDFMGLKVPKVLISGDHKKIAEWRKKHSK